MLDDTRNPSAPKVPRRDNLAAMIRTGRSVKTGTASAGGGHVRPGEPPKSARDYGHSGILQIGPKSSKWTVSIEHGRNIAPTWGELRPARPQLRPNLDQLAPTSAQLGSKMVQLDSNLDPFGSNFCPPQLGVKLSPKVPSCGMLELTWTSMCITWLQYGIWIGLGPTSPQHDQLAQVGPRWGRPRTKLGPIQLDATR